MINKKVFEAVIAFEFQYYWKIQKIVAVATEWLSMNFNRMSLPFGKNGNF